MSQPYNDCQVHTDPKLLIFNSVTSFILSIGMYFPSAENWIPAVLTGILVSAISFISTKIYHKLYNKWFCKGKLVKEE